MSYRSRFLLLSLIFGCFAASALGVDFKIAQQGEGRNVTVSVTAAGHYTLEIDDAYSFHVPVFSQAFDGKEFTFNAYDVGLTPGTAYYVRLNQKAPVQRFLLKMGTLPTSQANVTTMRSTWETLGRHMTEVYSGVKWNDSAQKWVVDDPSKVVGNSIYYSEMYIRAALETARCCNDSKLLDEIAQYYIVMLDRMIPLDTILKDANVQPLNTQRLSGANRSARTFRSILSGKVADCGLCNLQWMYPAARLIRIISLLPPDKRSATMKEFVAKYNSFIIEDQLVRYLTQELLPAQKGKSLNRIALWRAIPGGLHGERGWDAAMTDNDLWLLASDAEMLGANANDPSLAPINPKQLDTLRQGMDAGTKLFQSKATRYSDTKNFAGVAVGSTSYFNGDYDGHPDNAYTGATSATQPGPTQKRALSNVSWDMGHMYRVAVFVRALYDNRKATGTGYPKLGDVLLLVNQYVYKVFEGDLSRPLFRNFFDGTDGWYRVSYGKANFGYPPSKNCNMHDNDHPCLTPGQIMGWGLLAFANSDLLKLEQSLIGLQADNSPQAKAFRDQYYFYLQAFETGTQSGRPAYGAALYFLIADNAAIIDGCNGLNP
ncbi:hypothetical protein Acid345_3304 [Candidatus Koribacter versatilis Ellin345]|uniref:Cellulase Ig-like domain-containing protein n=1 Tax=Koribacter versatilis (strain Ellin345) TaxID=204669 RepID=Q1ILE5_KORVE|nr:hypothetical protein [Candidatus Koribacter versatilis]ABF42305.1 hypothetical protein Acid345_3304 [Candidatus Koribacter versatilis Ellin345]